MGYVFASYGTPLRSCYKPALTILWPGQYGGYGAVTTGIGIGAILSAVATLKIRIGDLAARQTQLNEATRFIDYIATAFFAAYGIEAALKFTSALPLAIGNASPGNHFAFLALVAAFAIPSCMLSGCGGGLVKGVVVDLVLIRPRNIWRTCCNWFLEPNLWIFAAIALLGFVFYELLDRTPLSFGSCAPVSDTGLYLTMLACSAIAVCAIWQVDPATRP
ncbi:hypothetical protein IVA80_31335 [Bradyrhizobium sp. 139]|uniref:hypothetical protein n=1 Tax=Bradyrhizobium sp. 139 TaxID=2782616 RepID=UPI001FFA65D8|nr:hypothetical protein [Bradyrhizobium sp. 139]MCK1745175.1 hypothetical protein [Bradyrhizobium sp. 139]